MKMVQLVIMICWFAAVNHHCMESTNNHTNIALAQCIDSKINNGKLNYDSAVKSVEKRLIDQKILVSINKSDYINLISALCSDSMVLNQRVFYIGNSDTELISRPSTLGVLLHCFTSIREEAKNKTDIERLNNIIDSIEELIERGDMADMYLIGKYFNSITEDDFSQVEYRIVPLFILSHFL